MGLMFYVQACLAQRNVFEKDELKRTTKNKHEVSNNGYTTHSTSIPSTITRDTTTELFRINHDRKNHPLAKKSTFLLMKEAEDQGGKWWITSEKDTIIATPIWRVRKPYRKENTP